MTEHSRTYRLGAVSFLNTLPLIDWFESRGPENVQVHRALPSRLPGMLARDEVDVALLPVVEIFRGKSGGMLSGTGIAGRGKVDSVKILVSGSWQNVELVLADRGSRSSVALLQVLFHELAESCPTFCEAEPKVGDLPKPGQAILVIGDRCFEFERHLNQHPRTDLSFLDLGQMWTDMTGLPFVFAAWAVSPCFEERFGREGVKQIKDLLLSARDHGFQNLTRLAEAAAKNGALGHQGEATTAAIDYYFRKSLRYELKEDELAGMTRFQELCLKHGLIQDSSQLKIL